MVKFRNLFPNANFPNANTVGRLMGAFRRGDRQAGSELIELCYPELRRLAVAKMRGERSEHTWQPTALVHELYLELVKIRSLNERDSVDEDERAAFFGLAGHMMKRLLIHHARPLYRRAEKVEIAEVEDAATDPLNDVQDALAGLAAVDVKLRAVVEMKVLEGLTGEEIAERLGCSRRSVANYWNVARQWLQKEWAGGRTR
ncbi:MAG TPA: ECF-type sigma factor [Bryobacteraceae bacterium]